MRNWRRILYFLLLNVLVSALTTWAVVSYILNHYAPAAQEAAPTLVLQPGAQGDEVVITQPAPTQAAGMEDEPEVTKGDLEIKAIIGAGEYEAERVEILHVGEGEISLAGWRLQDEDGHVYYFPSLTMFSAGAVTVYTQIGTSTVVELYWGLDEAIWEIGEKAYLVDPAGNIRALYEVP